MRRIFAGKTAVLAGIAIATPVMWLSHKLGNPYFDLGVLVAIGLILVVTTLVSTLRNDGPPATAHFKHPRNSRALEQADRLPIKAQPPVIRCLRLNRRSRKAL